MRETRSCHNCCYSRELNKIIKYAWQLLPDYYDDGDYDYDDEGSINYW